MDFLPHVSYTVFFFCGGIAAVAGSFFLAPQSFHRRDRRSLSAPSPPAFRQTQVPLVGVFWDSENVHVPKGVSAQIVAANIVEYLTQFGDVTQKSIYFDSNKSPTPNRLELDAAGFSLVDIPTHHGKEIVDHRIIADMAIFVADGLRMGASLAVCLISGDGDYSYVLSRLRDRRVKVILVSDKSQSKRLMACAEHRIPWSDILSAALIGGDAQDGGEVAGTDGAQDGYWEDERETSDDDVVRDLTASDIDEGRMNAFLFAVEQASTLRSCRVDENQDRWALIQAVQDVYRQKSNITGKLPTKMKRMLARLVNVACSQSYVTTAYRSKVHEGAMIPCQEAESRGNEHVYPEMYIRMLQPGKQVLDGPENFR